MERLKWPLLIVSPMPRALVSSEQQLLRCRARYLLVMLLKTWRPAETLWLYNIIHIEHGTIWRMWHSLSAFFCLLSRTSPRLQHHRQRASLLFLPCLCVVFVVCAAVCAWSTKKEKTTITKMFVLYRTWNNVSGKNIFLCFQKWTLEILVSGIFFCCFIYFSTFQQRFNNEKCCCCSALG